MSEMRDEFRDKIDLLIHEYWDHLKPSIDETDVEDVTVMASAYPGGWVLISSVEFLDTPEDGLTSTYMNRFTKPGQSYITTQGLLAVDRM